MKLYVKLILLFIGLVWYAGNAVSIEPEPIDHETARQYFADLKKISDADNGRLWGLKLYGPTMFVDPISRSVVANQSDRDGKLIAKNGIYIGSLGPEVNIANTATEWSGTYWTMVDWNELSGADQYDRERLLVHESWHRIQNELGITPVVTSNIYLDGLDGRVSLLLEFRALNHALLTGEKSKQKEEISDALTFRHYRHAQFPNNNENAFERHEGMAEYTGLKLCGLPDSLLCRIVAKKLQLGENNEGLANSFPYLTGPAIGLLLDQYDPGWRLKVCQGTDLPALLAIAVDWHVPLNKKKFKTAIDQLGAKYEATELFKDQADKSSKQEKVADDYRNRLSARGRLVIPNNNLQFSFNPQEKLIALDSIGVIYKTIRITGDFGVLEVANGILRTNDWQFFIAIAPDKTEGDSIAWEGYMLQLNPGWLVADKGKGIFIIEKL